MKSIEFHRKVFELVRNTAPPGVFKNLTRVAGVLRKRNGEWAIFFFNVFVDFVIESLDVRVLAEFLTRYEEIDLKSLPLEIELQFCAQIAKFREDIFGSTNGIPMLLKSKIKANTAGVKLLNVIPWDKLWTNHIQPIGNTAGIRKSSLFLEPDYQRDLLNAVGIETALAMPYRNRIAGGRLQEVSTWLASFADLDSEIQLYCTKHRISREEFEATAVNDILGLGLTTAASSPYEGETVLYYLSFPESVDLTCLKPTFLEGVIWSINNDQTLSTSLKDVFFLNSAERDGFGMTRSTYLGECGSCECISNGLNRLPDRTMLDFFSGKAFQIVCKCNFSENAVSRISLI